MVEEHPSTALHRSTHVHSGGTEQEPPHKFNAIKYSPYLSI